MGKYDIFISYRRSDARKDALVLASELKQRGYEVFRDFDEIEGSVGQEIYDAVLDAPIFMPILTREYLEQCCLTDSWIRDELEFAIHTRRCIMPVLFDAETIAIPDGISREMRGAITGANYNTIATGQLHSQSVDRLVGAIATNLTKQESKSGSCAMVHIITDTDCRIEDFSKDVGIAYPQKENILPLKPGYHSLKFISVEREDVFMDHEEFDVVDVKSHLAPIKVQLADKLAKQKIDDAFTGHEYVDLGLPSGLLWASCNVGANSPEEYGSYFAWGETSPKGDYIWSTLKYCIDNTGDSFSKYNKDQAGTKDNKTELEPLDDAAHANWGGGWRMPARKDWEELFNKQNCSRVWDKKRQGWVVKSEKNENSIFLPAAGFRSGADSYYVGESGYFWSSSLSEDYSYDACCCYFYFIGVYPSSCDLRCHGFSVRPVAAPLSPQ